MRVTRNRLIHGGPRRLRSPPSPWTVDPRDGAAPGARHDRSGATVVVSRPLVRRPPLRLTSSDRHRQRRTSPRRLAAVRRRRRPAARSGSSGGTHSDRGGRRCSSDYGRRRSPRRAHRRRGRRRLSGCRREDRQVDTITRTIRGPARRRMPCWNPIEIASGADIDRAIGEATDAQGRLAAPSHASG